jgi:hypothetical protein
VDLLREKLVLLAIECPYTKSNPPTCPLHDVRKLDPASIIDWLDGLSSEEKDFLTLYHQCCLVAQWEAEGVDALPPVSVPAPSAVGRKQTRKTAVARHRQPAKPRQGARGARRAG